MLLAAAGALEMTQPGSHPPTLPPRFFRRIALLYDTILRKNHAAIYDCDSDAKIALYSDAILRKNQVGRNPFVRLVHLYGMKATTTIAMLICLLILQVVAAEAAAQPEIAVGQETPITDFIDVPAEGSQTSPAAAWGPRGGLASWNDTRRGISEVWTALLTEGGTSKTVGRATPGKGGVAGPPAVGYSGDRFLVAWVESLESSSEVVGALYDGRGTLLESGIVIGEAGYRSEITLAGGATSFLVSFVDAEGALVARRVSTSGVPVGAPLEVYDESQEIGNPQLSWGDGSYLLTFFACDEDCRFGVRAARIEAGGKVLDPDGFPLIQEPPIGTTITSAWNGRNWVAVWSGGTRTYAVPVAPDERPGSNEPSTIMPRALFETDIEWTGSGFLLGYVDQSRGLYTSVLTDEPMVASPPLLVSGSTGDVAQSSLARAGDTFVLTWDERNGSYRDVFEIELLPTGVPTAERTILVQSAYGQIHPSVSAGIGASLALWQDYRDHSGPIVYGARLGPAGEPLDPQGFQISEQNGRHPVAAWNGESWLVVWKGLVAGSGALVGKRVGPDGSVLDPATIPIALGPGRFTDFDVASDGDGWVILYRDRSAAGLSSNYVSASGVPETSPKLIEVQGAEPSLAWHDDRYIAVWNRRGDIRGAFLSERGELLDAARRLTSNDLYDFKPSVASSGSSALVTWARCESDCPPSHIFGLMMVNSFDDGEPTRLSEGSFFDEEPISVFDGRAFGVVFKRCSAGCLRPDGIFRSVTEAGAPSGAEHEIATAHLTGAPAFSVASLGDGSFTITYRKVEGPSSAAGVPRGYQRTARRL